MKISNILVFLITLFQLVGQENNNIKSTKTSYYKTINDSLQVNFIENSHFDLNGNLIFTEVINDKNKIISIDSNYIEFNENGVMRKQIKIKKTNSLIETDVILYNSKGRDSISEKYNHNNKLLSSIFYSYSLNSKLIQKIHCRLGKDTLFTTLEYDENSNIIEEKCFKSDSLIQYRYVYKYHPNNFNYIEYVSFGIGNQLLEKELLFYDKLDNLIKCEFYDKREMKTRTWYYEYDKLNNIAKCERIDKFGQKEVSIYKYDIYNNWISIENPRDNNQLKKLSEREISYY